MDDAMCAALRNDLAVGLATLDLVEAEPAISAELRHFVGAARERLFAIVHWLEAFQDGDQLPEAIGLDENGRCAEVGFSVSGG